MSSRRLARQAKVAPVFVASEDPNRVTQQQFDFYGGTARAWFLGGVCRRVRLPGGRMFGWEAAPEVWAGIMDGSFRAIGYSRPNS